MAAGMKRSRILMRARKILRNDQLLLGILALLVGGATGGAIVAFREGIGLIQRLGFGTGGERLASFAAGLPWWQVMAVPALGGLAIGLFTRYVMPGGKALGVPDVIEAGALRNSRMSLRAGLLAALVSMASIGAGASVGREGPAVHLGGTLGGWLSSWLRLGRGLSRSLLGCGVAAAVAASFNAPIAGALFAHEVVIGHYALSAFAPIVLASIAGTMVTREYFGNFPAFSLPPVPTAALAEFPAFAGLGILAGLTALVFMHAIVRAERQFSRLPSPPWLRPLFGGLALGGLAIPFPQVLGVGYEVTEAALQGQVPLLLLVLLLAAKMAATALSLGSGFAGGVFGPALTVGALLGGAYGWGIAHAFPEMFSGPAVYALVGMGAVAAAVLGAPISTTLIIFELTGDYSVTLAVMLAVVIATVLTTQLLGRASFFDWQLQRRGLILGRGREAGLLRALTVRDVVKDCAAVPAGLPVRGLRLRLQQEPRGILFVAGDGGRLLGTVTLAGLGEAAFDAAFDDLMTAGDAARRQPPVLEAGDDLGTALKLMRTAGEDHIAVIDSRAAMRLIGCIGESDALRAYNRALVQARAEERGERAAPPF